MVKINRKQVAGMNCHYYNYSLDYFLHAQERLGFQTIALWGGAPHFDLDYLSYSKCEAIRKKAQSKGLEIKCFTAAGCTYGYQICMQPKEMFEKSICYFKNGIQAASELGCTMMAANSGWGYWNEKRESAWKRSVEMLSILSETAKEHNITLTMESLRREESQLVVTLEDAIQMFHDVHHPNLKIMIDTTAIGVAGETVQQWFDAFGPEIINTHFVDGTPYGHLAWGDGKIPLERMLDSFQNNGYDGLFGLEVTDSRYYDDPIEADRKNMEALKRYFDE